MEPSFHPKSARRTLAQLFDPPLSFPPSARHSIAMEAPYVLRSHGPSLIVLGYDYNPVGSRAELHVDYWHFPRHAFARAALDLSADGVSHSYSGPGAEFHWLWDGHRVQPPHRSIEALRAYRRRVLWMFGERGLARIADLLERDLGDLGCWEKPFRITCAACGGIDTRGLCARCGRCDPCSQRYVDGDPVGDSCIECGALEQPRGETP